MILTLRWRWVGLPIYQTGKRENFIGGSQKVFKGLVVPKSQTSHLPGRQLSPDRDILAEAVWA